MSKKQSVGKREVGKDCSRQRDISKGPEVKDTMICLRSQKKFTLTRQRGKLKNEGGEEHLGDFN
jgi:hypothetical protein